MTSPVVHSSGDEAIKRLDAIQIEKHTWARKLAQLLKEEMQIKGLLLLKEEMNDE